MRESNNIITGQDLVMVEEGKSSSSEIRPNVRPSRVFDWNTTVCGFCHRSHLPQSVHPHISYPVHIAGGRRHGLYCKLRGGLVGRKLAEFGSHI